MSPTIYACAYLHFMHFHSDEIGGDDILAVYKSHVM